MNAFYAGNGFKTVDRTDMSDDEVHFSNIWGVADDDLFAKTIKEADASYAAGTPFMSLLMTTSNHRPYTYPDGRISIASPGGREGGVMYADYAVGKLIEWSKEKPWFKDTVFIFVADHTHGAGGKVELNPQKYHIPLIFYAPGFIKPARYERLASQVDIAPTLLGMLNFSYRSKFYGTDLSHGDAPAPRAFISNYQKMALIKDGEMTVLAPKQAVSQYSWPDVTPKAALDETGVEDAIAYYQSASWWRESDKREDTLIGK